MKSIFRIVTTLLIAISIVVFGGADSIKTTASLGIIEVSSNPSESLTQSVDDHLYPTEDGYIDQNGKIVLKLPPKSHPTLPRNFSEGLSAVRMPHAYSKYEPGLGYIDRTGKVIIPPKFIDWEELRGSENFSEGLAVFVSPKPDKQGRYLTGYMDKSGKVIIPAKFANAYSFVDGIARVEIHTKFKKQDTIRFAYINRQGKFIFEHPHAFQSDDFSQGLAAVVIDNKIGFINSNGKFVIAPEFSAAGQFVDGLAPAVPSVTNCRVLKYGYIDTNGKFVIEPKFDRAEEFSEGLAAVKIDDDNGDGKWGYIDKSGKYIIPPKFPDALGGARYFHEGLAAVNIPDAKSVNGLAGYIDRTGEFVIPPQFNQGIGDFIHGLAYIHTAFIDPNSRSESDPLAYNYSGGKRGYIDRQGRFVWEKTYKLQ